MTTIDTIKKNDILERDRVLAYLSRREEYTLYSHLNAAQIPPYYYVVKSDSGDIVGVAAYFPLFQSCSLFTEDETVARMCVRTLVKNHSIKAFLGIAGCGTVAYDEFVKLGQVCKGNPKKIFMELDYDNFHFTDYDNSAALSCYRSLGFRGTNEYYMANFSGRGDL